MTHRGARSGSKYANKGLHAGKDTTPKRRSRSQVETRVLYDVPNDKRYKRLSHIIFRKECYVLSLLTPLAYFLSLPAQVVPIVFRRKSPRGVVLASRMKIARMKDTKIAVEDTSSEDKGARSRFFPGRNVSPTNAKVTPRLFRESLLRRLAEIINIRRVEHVIPDRVRKTILHIYPR